MVDACCWFVISLVVVVVVVILFYFIFNIFLILFGFGLMGCSVSCSVCGLWCGVMASQAKQVVFVFWLGTIGGFFAEDAEEQCTLGKNPIW